MSLISPPIPLSSANPLIDVLEVVGHGIIKVNCAVAMVISTIPSLSFVSTSCSPTPFAPHKA